ncbi:MAG: MBOAT family protein [Clostridia bacterium]|nr:MBOAT family protein [Clostridia bacterium]
MSYISFAFAGFLAASVLGYYFTPKRFRWIVLLLFSLEYYLSGGVKAMACLAFTVVTSWAAGLLLDSLNARRKDVPKEDKPALERIKKYKQALVAVTLILNFGMLWMLKYLDFTVGTLSGLLGKFGILWDPVFPGFVMPVGVSFFLFQSVGYVIDCYRGKYPAQRNIAKFALFVSFFPQMVQGPISRYDKLAPQLMAGNDLNTDSLRDGILRILWGYFKKMVIADRAGAVVSAFFADYASYSGTVTAAAILFYCINLYCDFSGGIDITIGSAQLFGITVEENFRRPIFARDLAEYWRRWHITLGGWMRDYVFYPISLSPAFGKLGKWSRRKFGGKLGKILPTSAATFIVYLIIGIWHGANFRYIAYGFWNGAIITSSILLTNVYDTWKKKLGIREDGAWWKLFCTARTWFLVFLGRYITRSPRLLVGLSLIIHTFNPFSARISDLWNGTMLNFGLTGGDYAVIAVSVAVMLAVEWYEEHHGSVREMLAKQNGIVQWLAVTALLLVILLLGIFRGSYISSAFIYGQF